MILDTDKIMPLFQPRKPPFLSISVSLRTGCEWTGSLRMSGPKLYRFQPIGLSRLGRHAGMYDVNSSRSLKPLMSWKSEFTWYFPAWRPRRDSPVASDLYSFGPLMYTRQQTTEILTPVGYCCLKFAGKRIHRILCTPVLFTGVCFCAWHNDAL